HHPRDQLRRPGRPRRLCPPRRPHGSRRPARRRRHVRRTRAGGRYAEDRKRPVPSAGVRSVRALDERTPATSRSRSPPPLGPATPVDARHPLRSAADLFRSRWWTIGWIVAFVAFAFHAAALALAPLSVVQAVVAGGLVFLAVLAERVFGFKLGRREWMGVAIA